MRMKTKEESGASFGESSKEFLVAIEMSYVHLNEESHSHLNEPIISNELIKVVITPLIFYFIFVFWDLKIVHDKLKLITLRSI